MAPRLDVYLFAIRIFKTRTLAQNAIADGKVKLNGENCKPSRPVRVGEQYSIKTNEKRLSIQVKELIMKRVQYSEAILMYYDISTEEEKDYHLNKQSSTFFTGKRLSKQGRPTKKNQRDIQDFFGETK